VSDPRRNASIRPSGDNAGYTAESVKEVSCSHLPGSVRAGPLRRKYKNIPTLVSSPTATVATTPRTHVTFPATACDCRRLSAFRIALQPLQVGSHFGGALVSQSSVLLERFATMPVNSGGAIDDANSVIAGGFDSRSHQGLLPVFRHRKAKTSGGHLV